MSETVFVINGSDTYHRIRNCCNGVMKSDKRRAEWDEETAQAWGKTECKYCSGQVDWWEDIYG